VRIPRKGKLLAFMLRTSMWLPRADEDLVVSFMRGYECGRGRRKGFTAALSGLIAKRHGIEARADGWVGQVRRMAERAGIPWLRAFKRAGLAALAALENGGLSGEMRDSVKWHVKELADLMEDEPRAFLNREWVEEWMAVCDTAEPWFMKLWTAPELEAIDAMSAELKANATFTESGTLKPTGRMLEHKSLFLCCLG